MATGYSGTPPIKKMGISGDMKLLILNPPDEDPDFIHVFATSQKEFHVLYEKIKLRLRGNVSVWVSWYKKIALRQAQGKLVTDLTEDRIREFALKNNLVDIKVCAVTEIWSGLKLVIPIAKR